MFPNKKIVYIFVSIGDENAKISQDVKKKSFFENLKKIFSKNENVIKENKSDIYQILDKLTSSISKYSEKKCYCFYLNQEKTHEKFITDIQRENADRYYVFPMYPQYNLEMNKIANFFSLNLYDDIVEKFFWIKSYGQHPIFAKALQKTIKTVLKKNNLDEKDTFFLFLAKSPINYSPLYYFESEITCQNTVKAFPYVEGILHFFSDDIHDFKIKEVKKRKNVIIIPITSLTDDYQTKEKLNDFKSYLEKQKNHVFITKTLNQSSYFIRSIFDIIDEKNFVSNEMLLM
ncbi:MAG: Ferrochelatase [Candidatus Anoxychlamydiales bacterium]|nr:Ferrochelatase [Candidatus Anoxychlamydiales bacterium]NGX40737.1 Ferrochelatase [Candidatus Anoxychlamydiales bacterium]